MRRAIEEVVVYTLEFDEQNRLLIQRASGFWDMEEFVRYEADLTAVVTRLRSDGRPFTLLFDSRDMPPQSGEVVNAFARMADARIMNPTGRAAILVSRILSKLQADRIVQDPLVQVFSDEGEARAWLAEPV